MKKTFRSINIILVITILFTSLFTISISAATVKLSNSKITITISESQTLTLKNFNGKVKWSSEDKKIATVDATGKVVGKAVGETIIIATVGDDEYYCEVSVKKFRVYGKNSIMQVGDTQTLKLRGKVGDLTVKWTTSDKNIATVSSKGVVTAKSAGQVKIYATVDGKKYSKTLTIENNKKYSYYINTSYRTFTDVTGISLKENLSVDGKTICVYDYNNSTDYKKYINYLIDIGFEKSSSSTDTNIYLFKDEEMFGVSINKSYNEIWIIVPQSNNNLSTVDNGVQVSTDFGDIEGNITYLYNKYRGNVSDTRAKIILIPTNGISKSLINYPYSTFMFLTDNEKLNKNGIFAGEVDGTGFYSIQNIPIGEYKVLIRSEQTSDKGFFDNEEAYYSGVYNAFKSLLNEDTAKELSKSVSFNKYYITTITIKKDKITKLSYDFGITYI